MFSQGEGALGSGKSIFLILQKIAGGAEARNSAASQGSCAGSDAASWACACSAHSVGELHHCSGTCHPHLPPETVSLLMF